MKIAKDFKWEMGHRLFFHKGKCKNLHGHSYKLRIELEGKQDKNGILLDYYDLKKIVSPIIDKLDHSFLVYEKDKELIRELKKLNSKFTVVPFEATAENICSYFLSAISKTKLPSNINSVKILIWETEDSYAETFLKL